MQELPHVLIEGPRWVSSGGIRAIFVLPTYFMGPHVLPSSGSGENIHSGAQALRGQEVPGMDGRTME